MKNARKLAAAIYEAKRFIAAAKRVQRARTYQHGIVVNYEAGPKESGAARRASMDLTRALAELRKPN